MIPAKPNLRRVTAVVFDHQKPRDAVHLLAAMSDLCDFGDLKYLNHFDGYPQFLYWENYEFYKFIRTDFALFLHLDGYILHPARWEPEFLKYDYIGAPWPKHINADRVGNGGFCLKSRRLMSRVAQLPWVNVPGDVMVCSHYRRTLLHEGFTFAPPHVAARFSTEMPCPESVPESFGFHGTISGHPLFTPHF